MEVIEQIKQQLSAEVEPQGWRLYDIQEQSFDAPLFYLGMYPEKKKELYAVYIVAFIHPDVPGFFNCCAVYVWNDGRAQSLEWWARTVGKA